MGGYYSFFYFWLGGVGTVVGAVPDFVCRKAEVIASPARLAEILDCA